MIEKRLSKLIMIIK